jgi:myo-inositol 2-dehydrogenase / D-chiro-inositol 1-dehydrogenase
MAVKVGVLGAGYIGRIHAQNLRGDSRVAVTGIVDVVPRAAERLASDVASRPLPSLDALLDAGVEALYVTTPNTQHLEPVLAALAHGVHVFSEKPMAASLADARRIRDASQRSKGIYQIGFNRRFANVYQFARRLIDDGRLTPLVAQMKHNRGELRQPPWTADPTVTGGFLYETPVHLFDLARFFFGEVAEIQGWARRSVYRELDGFTMLLRCAGGVITSFTSVAHTSWLFPSERIEIYGEHKSVVTEEIELAAFSPGMRDPAEAIDCRSVPFEVKAGYVTEDRLFIDAVLGERPPAVTAEDGYRATELVEACYRAARGGKPVPLPLES